MNLAAGIVLFNPELSRLKCCIDSILHQCETLYIFDNSSSNEQEINYIEILTKTPNSIVYHAESSNKGIAYALNRIMESAGNDGYDWVITIDQDSIMPDGIVSDYVQYIKKNDKSLAIICPQVIDKRRSYMETKIEPREEYLNDCITSASCTSIRAWEQAGGFDEWLFIDLVDNEFCKRLIVSGYKILRLNKWVLDQEFGNIVPKSDREQKFWIGLSKLLFNKNIAKFSYKKFVDPIRVYYTNRNIIYINRKLKAYGKTGYHNYNCKGYLGFLICFSVPSVLRAQEKVKVLRAVFKGIEDGLKSKPDKWSI